MIIITFAISCAGVAVNEPVKKHISNITQWTNAQKKDARVLSVIKTTGEYIVFQEKNLGKLQNANVTGTFIKDLRISIPKPKIKKSTPDPKAGTLAVETIDGSFYVLHSPQISAEEISGMIKRLYNPIPFSEIEWIWIIVKHMKSAGLLKSISPLLIAVVGTVVGIGIAALAN
jgi:hypothetical protein